MEDFWGKGVQLEPGKAALERRSLFGARGPAARPRALWSARFTWRGAVPPGRHERKHFCESEARMEARVETRMDSLQIGERKFL